MVGRGSLSYSLFSRLIPPYKYYEAGTSRYRCAVRTLHR